MHLWQGVLQHILAACTVYVGCGGELTVTCVILVAYSAFVGNI